MDFLTIDSSKSCTGYARWKVGDDKPTFGSFSLGDEFTDDRTEMVELYRQMRMLCTFSTPDVLCIEAPANTKNWKGGRNFEDDCLLIGFVSTAKMTSKLLRIRICTTVGISTWFPDFNKRGFAKAEEHLSSKQITMQTCRLLGMKPENADQADALGILDYTVRLHGIKPPWRANEVLRPPLVRAGR